MAKKEVKIRDDFNYTIEILAPTSAMADNSKAEDEPTETEWIAFKVNKEICKQKSRWLDTMFSSGLAESNSDTLPFSEKNLGVELWLRAWHETLDIERFDCSWDEARNSVVTSKIYGFVGDGVEKWYREWIQRKRPTNLVDHKNTLFLSYFFDEPVTFASSSRYLVYNSQRHIRDNENLTHNEYRLPIRIFSQLNSSRGSLQKSLFLWVHAPKLELLAGGNDTSACCKYAYFAYGQGLFATGCWPQDANLDPQRSLAEILKGLETFKYTTPTDTCMKCTPGSNSAKKSYEMKVRSAINNVRVDFDGLCLDCMKGAEPIEDFLTNERQSTDRANRTDWCVAIRLKHGEPTYYFSNLARKDESDSIATLQASNTRKDELKRAFGGLKS